MHTFSVGSAWRAARRRLRQSDRSRIERATPLPEPPATRADAPSCELTLNGDTSRNAPAHELRIRSHNSLQNNSLQNNSLRNNSLRNDARVSITISGRPGDPAAASDPELQPCFTLRDGIPAELPGAGDGVGRGASDRRDRSDSNGDNSSNSNRNRDPGHRSSNNNNSSNNLERLEAMPEAKAAPLRSAAGPPGRSRANSNSNANATTQVRSAADYTLRWLAADPAVNKGKYLPTYDKLSPADYTQKGYLFPEGALDLPAGNPLDNAVAYAPGGSTSDLDAVTSLAPKDMALGQIVPFLLEITVAGASSAAAGTISVSSEWLTKTTSGQDFGFDPTVGNGGIVAAFVDRGETGGRPGSSARVASYSTKLADPGGRNEAIQGTFQIADLNSGETVYVEIWMALKKTIAAGVTGNVQTALLSAQTVPASGSGSGSGEKINVGQQTIPLLNVGEFFSEKVDLSVIKSDSIDAATNPLSLTAAPDTDPADLKPGDRFTYTILATNNSPDTVANGVVVTDTLDPYLTYVSSSDSGVYSDNDSAADTVRWNLGSLEPGESRKLSLQVLIDGLLPPEGGVLSLLNNVSISGLSADPNSANNSNSEPTLFDPEASLAIDKTLTSITDVRSGIANGKADDAGDTLNYSITLTNTGNISLSGVRLDDPLAGLALSDKTLAPGQSLTVPASYRLTQADLDGRGGGDGSIDNTATADANEVEPVSDTVREPLLYAPALTIEKTLTSITDVRSGAANGKADDAGDTLNYSITLTNTGNISLSGVRLDDPLAGLALSDKTLAPGESLTVPASYRLTQADLDGRGGGDDSIDNTATADANEVEPVSDTVREPLLYAPALTIDKTLTSITDVRSGIANGKADDAGDTLNYSITLTNTGNISLSGVRLDDPLAALTLSDKTLAPGQSLTVPASYRLTQADLDGRGGGDGSIDNTATADANEAEPVSDTVREPLLYAPALTIDKTLTSITDVRSGIANGKADDAGDTLNYSITLTNTGNISLSGVRLDDPLAGLALSDKTLAPGQSLTVPASYRLTQADLDGRGGGDDSIDNTATADANEVEPVSDTVREPLLYAPALTIDKVTLYEGQVGDGLRDVIAGRQIGWRYSVSNSGNVALSALAVSDSVKGVSPVLDADASLGEEDGQLNLNDLWVYTATGKAVAAAYSNIGTATASFGAIDVSASDASSYQGKEATLIAPTGTTPEQYISGNAQTFAEYYSDQEGVIQYNVRTTGPAASRGTIISANPGVFFYYTGLSGAIVGRDGADADTAPDTLTLRIDQSARLEEKSGGSLLPPLQTTRNDIKLYKVNDGNSNGLIDASDSLSQVQIANEQIILASNGDGVSDGDSGDLQLSFTPDQIGSQYVLSVKYRTDAVVGTSVGTTPGAWPRVRYRFATDVGADTTVEESSSAGIGIAPKLSSLMLRDAAGDGAPALRRATLRPVLAQALEAWGGQGLAAADLDRLTGTRLRIRDLGGQQLALSSGRSIWIDDDAAGHGWSTAADAPAATGVDLLSVVVHEFGHRLGFDHRLMAPSLGLGERDLTPLSLIPAAPLPLAAMPQTAVPLTAVATPALL